MKVIEEVYSPNHTYIVETKPCFHCKEVGTVEIPSQELFDLNQGKLIQEALVSVPKELREQILTGTHPNCWIELFGPEE